MGFSDIAKAPVSHGVEPHDLETGPGLRVGPRLSSSRATSRRPYRASGLVLGRIAVDGRTARTGGIVGEHGTQGMDPHRCGSAGQSRMPIRFDATSALYRARLDGHLIITASHGYSSFGQVRVSRGQFMKTEIAVAAGLLTLALAAPAAASPAEYSRGYNDCLYGRYDQESHSHAYRQGCRAAEHEHGQGSAGECPPDVSE